MFRLLCRFLGLWLAAATLVMGVVDGAKSIAASRFVLTSFRENWATLTAFARPGAGASPPGSASWPVEILSAWLMSAPTLAVLGVASFLLLALGRRHRRADIGREFAA